MVDPLPSKIDDLATKVLGAAFLVHRQLGPGLIESVYERCLAYGLTKAGISHEAQTILPVVYDGVQFESGLR